MIGDPEVFDRGGAEGPANLEPIDLGEGRFVPIVEVFPYLGSMIARDATSMEDVQTRVRKASNAFGMLRQCIFASPHVSPLAKRLVYSTYILGVLLYGAESWCLTAKQWAMLRTFHAKCVRVMCSVSKYQQWRQHIKDMELGLRLGISGIDLYVQRKQMQWVGKMVLRGMSSLPRHMMSSWVYRPNWSKTELWVRRVEGAPAWGRPKGCPEYTWGRGIMKTIRGLTLGSDWFEMAKNFCIWQTQVLDTKLKKDPSAKEVREQSQRPAFSV